MLLPSQTCQQQQNHRKHYHHLPFVLPNHHAQRKRQRSSPSTPRSFSSSLTSRRPILLASVTERQRQQQQNVSSTSSTNSNSSSSSSISSSKTTTFMKPKQKQNTDVNTILTQLSQFGAGALAGLVNTLVLSPLDVVKTRLQAQTLSGIYRYSGPIHALRLMLHEEGISSYYRGLSASLWAFVPNWAIYWYSYETFKRLFNKHKHQPPSAMTHVLSAVSAGGITALTTAPFWTLKSRLQVDFQKKRYKSIAHGFKTIIKEEGFTGLYKGLTPTLLGLGHVAIQFPLYEYVKSKLAVRRQRQHLQLHSALQQSQYQQQQEPHSQAHYLKATDILIASSISKIAASAIFYPHEVVRTRFQVDRSVVRQSSELTRVVSLFKEIIKKDGVKGLYRGFAANLVRTVPACMLTFTSYELAKRFAERQSIKHMNNKNNNNIASHGIGRSETDIESSQLLKYNEEEATVKDKNEKEDNNNKR